MHDGWNWLLTKSTEDKLLHNQYMVWPWSWGQKRNYQNERKIDWSNFLCHLLSWTKMYIDESPMSLIDWKPFFFPVLNFAPLKLISWLYHCSNPYFIINNDNNSFFKCQDGYHNIYLFCNSCLFLIMSMFGVTIDTMDPLVLVGSLILMAGTSAGWVLKDSNGVIKLPPNCSVILLSDHWMHISIGWTTVFSKLRH